MAMPASLSRLADYYNRHGLWGTLTRARTAAKRAVISNRMILFSFDIMNMPVSSVRVPSSLAVERLRNYSEMDSQTVEEMTSFWNPAQAHQNIQERFQRGASLWLTKSGSQLAGYGWTLQGGTIEPHYFPLAPDDVHLFDFHVFPQFRGHGINPLLVTYILDSLAGECKGRAFIEAAEWNNAQLSSLRKTPFRQIGWAKKSTIFHRTILRLAPGEVVGNHLKDTINAH
jgi:ribosomal protein S18 acetylase RimI-like enzyme